MEAHRHFQFSGAGTPDGRFLIGCVLRDNFLDTKGTAPGDVALYEIATGKVQTLAPMQRPDSQMISAAADDNWIAWMESDDADAYNWSLFAADRATGEVHEVARAATRDGHPVPGPLTFIGLSHGSLVWGQAIGDGITRGNLANAVVNRHDLASGKTETVATAAGSPAFSWPWLVWEEFPAGGQRRSKVTNLETGATEQTDTVPATIVLDGGSAAYSAADLHSIWLIDDVSKPSSGVAIAHGIDDADYLQWPSLNDRLVAWSQDDASTVYDRAEHRLVHLPVANGWSSGIVTGPNVVWTERDPGHDPSADHADWIVVADTGTLPVLP